MRTSITQNIQYIAIFFLALTILCAQACITADGTKTSTVKQDSPTDNGDHRNPGNPSHTGSSSGHPSKPDGNNNSNGSVNNGTNSNVRNPNASSSNGLTLTKDRNYQVVRLLKTDENKLENVNLANSNTLVTYADGLGATMQKIVVQGAADKRDIVTPVDIDGAGVETRKLLPFLSSSTPGAFRTNSFSKQKQFYLKPEKGIPSTSNPQKTFRFSQSPDRSVTQVNHEGNAWAPNSGRALKVEYGSNHKEKVTYWTKNTDGSVSATQYFPYNSLHWKKVTDEDGHSQLEYFNPKDQLVQNTLGNQTTCYVYNEKGQLELMIPPQALASRGLIRNRKLTKTEVDQYCWQYKYDGLGQLIEMKRPGAEPTYYLFNKLGQMIMSQDGELRKQNAWYFSKYDAQGRMILEGIHYPDQKLSKDVLYLQIMSQQASASTPVWEKLTNGGAHFGYTNQSYPILKKWKMLKVHYFDDYDFDNDGSPDVAFISDRNFPNLQPAKYVQNKPTAIRVALLNPDAYAPGASSALLPQSELSVSFYSAVGEVIQTQKQ
ncbi:MAG: DUF6443 domain-containing protein [Bacteroidota bacterium]